MSKSQNKFIKNQREKQKKQARAGKLERKHNKKNVEPKTDIHDMSKLERPEELGFLPEEKFLSPNKPDLSKSRTQED